MSSARQTQVPIYPLKYNFLTLGDSRSDLRSLYVRPELMYHQIAANLCNTYNQQKTCQARVMGMSGYTSAQILGVADFVFLYTNGLNVDTPLPAVGLIYCGVNDVSSQGTLSGTAVAGSTSTTFCINSSAGITQQMSFFGQTLTINSGTGSGQTNTITGYNPATNTFTVLNSWTTTPDNTSVYTIANPSQTLMQQLQQCLIKVFKYHVYGAGAGLGQPVVLYSQTMLPSGGQAGQRYIIFNDNSSTGGSGNSANLPGINTQITTNYSSSPIQSVWEYRNPSAGEAGWARVAITGTTPFSNGVSKIMIIGSAYLNFASGGDNYNVTAGTGTQYSANVPVRAAQAAAASAESVVYVDYYSYQSMLIYGGTLTIPGANGFNLTVTSQTTQGSNSWYALVNAQHENSLGHWNQGNLVFQYMLGQGWVTNFAS